MNFKFGISVVVLVAGMLRMQCMDGMDTITMGTVCGWSSLEVAGALAEEAVEEVVVEPQEADMDPHLDARNTEW